MPNDRTILHCDLNGFYASVEGLSHPELKDKPMAVGGNPQSRKGIILAKNEIAKRYGVATGETIWSAKRKCPNLVVLPPHHEMYEIYSQKVNAIYNKFTNRVEPFGIDESWLDVTSSIKLFGSGVEIADKIRNTIKAELGLTVSVGVSFNKVFAKLGSDFKKPDATTLFDRNALPLIHSLPVKDLLFVGKNCANTLTRLNIRTIGELANASENIIVRYLGKLGAELHKYARGEDDSPVGYYGEEDEAKSVGNSMTFKRDLVGENDYLTGFCKVAEKVSKRLKDLNLKTTGISITIKDANFNVITRQTTLTIPTNSYRELVNNAMKLAKANWNFQTPVRMLGIACSKLSDSKSAFVQGDLFEQTTNKKAKIDSAENVMFKLKEKFGNSIKFGNMIDEDL